MLITRWTKGLVAVATPVGFAAMVAISSLAAQDIYKTVDEYGNTVYTDQKPSDDAQPVKLKALTVVDPAELGNEQAVVGASQASGRDDSAPDFDLRISAPVAEASILNTAYVLTVQVQIDHELPDGASLAYLIDGEVRSITRARSVEIEEVYRGEHQVNVELRASDGRILDRAGPVTFYMRQHSRLNPNPG